MNNIQKTVSMFKRPHCSQTKGDKNRNDLSKSTKRSLCIVDSLHLQYYLRLGSLVDRSDSWNLALPSVEFTVVEYQVGVTVDDSGPCYSVHVTPFEC